MSYIFIISACLGWAIAQALKYVLAVIKKRSARALSNLYISGGMPSAHSSTVMALATSVGMYEGLDSAIFAVSLVLAAIVMYDAMMVRRSSGKQGEILTRLVKNIEGGDTYVPYFAKGHEPIEVLVGAILGIIIGVVVYFTTI